MLANMAVNNNVLLPNYEKMVDELRENFRKGKTLPYEFRLNQLKNLQRLLEENLDDIESALHKDLRRHKMESSGELLPLKVEVADAIRLLSSWMVPDKLPTCLLLPNDRAFMQHDPYGVVLVIGTWHLALQRMLANMAVNNNVLLPNYEKMVDELRENFRKGKTLPYEFRLNQLKNLQRLLEENLDDIESALHKDLRRHKMESSGELLPLKVEVADAIRLLSSWMVPDKLPTCLLLPNDRAFMQHDPYGVVLVIGTWNYPMLLTLEPLVGAISAGNCAVLKLSEGAPCTGSKLAELLPRYLDTTCYKVIFGGAEEATALLKVKFDYIFATCSSRIGRKVMAAAVENLTPVTLELGGKCPLYLHESADMEIATKRILWGKMINNGQSCIAPDYILCSRSVEEAFILCAKRILLEWYGTDDKSSPDITRIINNHHFNRLKKLLENTKGQIVVGGNADSSDLWISPTIVVDVKSTDVLMEDEIFGPILPIIRMDSPQQCVDYLNARKDKPLSLYLFSKDKEVNKLFTERTTSGTLTLNEVMLQCGWQEMPFGGVGESGMGKYHGKYSYETFTHKKGVLVRDYSFITENFAAIRYPPYSSAEQKLQFLYMFLKNLHYFNIPRNIGIQHVIAFFMGVVAMIMFGVLRNNC